MLADTVLFDRYELQPRQRRLLMEGVPVTLGARAFDVLVALVERAGSLVGKNELLERVWAGLVVEEANLTVQVSNLRKVLGGELIATIPGRGYRFAGSIEPAPGAAAAPSASTAPFPPRAPVAAPPSAAPALVGRRAELERLRAALSLPGCITLVGPSGVGKTSLARALVADRPPGFVWVDLAALTDGAQVGAALARALGRPESALEGPGALLKALDARLLVLDNAEHLIDAVALHVAELLAAAPELALLVTCQLPLSIAGERVQRVEPLALAGAAEGGDGAEDDDSGDGGEGGALALFVARARAADHRFSPAGHGPLLRAICGQLDGLPLALEMAAARVPALGLRGLHDALAQRFAVLTRGARTAAARHRTLHAALDWSHGLLQPEEQRLFRALGVFAGGFTLELAVALGSDAAHDRWSVIDTLAALVDRSLVATDAGEPPRYRLLETMRAYALEQLQATGEVEARRARHAEVIHALFERASQFEAPESVRAEGLAEHDNAREALAWATLRRPALAVPLSTRVVVVASFVSWRSEALRWMEACESVIDADTVLPASRAAWWAERARQLLISRRPQARRVAEHACELTRALGDERALFMALVALVRSSGPTDGDVPERCRELEALLAAHPEWPPHLAMVLAGTQAAACDLSQDHEGALRHRCAELELARLHGTHRAVDVAESNVVNVLYRLGRYDEALQLNQALLQRLAGHDGVNLAYAWNTHTALLATLRRHAELRACAQATSLLFDRYQMPYHLEHWARLLIVEGRPRAAAQVVGRALALFDQWGLVLSGSTLEGVDETRALAVATIGDGAWEAGVAQGRGLDAAGALALLQAAPAEA